MMSRNFENWLDSAIKSIVWGFIPLAGYLVYEIGIPKNFAVSGWPLFITLTIIVYLMGSLIGWLFLGFPLNWLINKYLSPKIYFYLMPLVILTLLLGFFVSSELAVFLGIFSIIQAAIFWYYAFKT